jgi:acetolactate synthase-1/2/3 large subunit
VRATRVSTPDEFTSALKGALERPGPHLIEAMVPPALSGLKLKLLPHLLGSLDRMPLPMARMLKRKLAP